MGSHDARLMNTQATEGLIHSNSSSSSITCTLAKVKSSGYCTCLNTKEQRSINVGANSSKFSYELQNSVNSARNDNELRRVTKSSQAKNLIPSLNNSRSIVTNCSCRAICFLMLSLNWFRRERPIVDTMFDAGCVSSKSSISVDVNFSRN